MGTFVGHILPGTGFVLLGLWHMYNIILGNMCSPWSYKPRTWYPPTSLGRHFRHAELYCIIAGACGSIAGELLPNRFWSVTTHLNNFEHSTISLTLLLYATFALVIDVLEIHALQGNHGRIYNKKLTKIVTEPIVHVVPQGWLHVAAVIALSEELLLFHFHSADHMGLEGHYHALLQIPVAIAIFALLAEIFILHLPVVAILRSMSFVLQGSWFILMGFVLWTPSLVPSGCYRTANLVDCPTPDTLMAAKSLANLEFAWLISGVFFLTGAALIVTLAYFKKRCSYRCLVDEDPGLEKILHKDVELGEGFSPPNGSQDSYARS